MSTVNRKYPTYRDLVKALAMMCEEDLDLPIQIRASEDDRYTNALFEYNHDINDPTGPHIGFVTAPRIEDDDLIRYNLVENYCGEIIKEDLTYPEIIEFCRAENLSIKRFDKAPNAYGQFYCEVSGYYEETFERPVKE